MDLPINELCQSLKQKLTNGLGKVFEALAEIIPAQSPKFNTLINLKSRHKKYKKDWLLKVISQEDAELQSNQLNMDMLAFIDDLEEKDFQEKTENKADHRVGKVCFRIPPTMQVNERNDCKVWISFDEDTILKEIQLEIDDQLQNVRVSDTMGVELFCDEDGEAFSIKTYDELVQPIEDDLTTQWNFRVTPLKVGTYPLILKIIAVVEQRGKALKKSIVLEEEINIVATPNSDVAEAKQLAGKTMMNGFGILLGFLPEGNAPLGGVADAAIESSTTATQSGGGFSIAKALLGLAILIGGFFLIQNFLSDRGEGEKKAVSDCLENTSWESIQSSGDTMQVLNYLKNCPDGKYATEANNLLSSWRNVLSQEESVPLELDTTKVNPVDTTYTREMLTQMETPSTPISTPEKKVMEDTISFSPPIEEKPTTIKSIPATPTVVAPIDYRVAAFKPVHPDCISENQNKWEECTVEEIRELVEKYVRKNRRNLEGAVKVSFIIQKDGSINTDVSNENDNEKLTKAVIKALQKLPKFKPGQDTKGQPVEIKYTVPVRIK